MLRVIKNYLFFILLLFCFGAKAQTNAEAKRANHWYFGNKAGLDFSTGSPIVDLNSAMSLGETGSVISDTAGNLLFYTNGDTIWNKNHQVMANGTGLINCSSASQGGLVVKKPGINNLFYVFNNDCGENGGINGVNYSVIDMNLNAGLGAVITKNVLLYAPSTEKLTAVYHCNNTDIWIVGQTRNSNQFRAYLLDNIGINPIPVMSNIGYFHNDNAFFILAGVMKFSPNGEKLALAYTTYPNGIEELYDFNSATGSIYNLITLPPDTSEFGVTFSNDNKKLYIGVVSGGGVGNKIFQYDLSTNTPSVISASKTLIHYNKWSSPVLALQNSVDGKIYCSRFYLDSVAVINNPQLNGVACNYNHTAISLNGRISRENFPQFLESYFSISPTSASCSSGIPSIESDFSVDIFPNPAVDYFLIHSKKQEKITLQISDLLGQNIFSADYFGDEIKINCSFLNSGLYTLTIKTKYCFKQTKLIINKS